MQIKRDFDYYFNLSFVVSNALLHLLVKVSESQRFVPVSTRNEILIKYLKPKMSIKAFANVKKDIKLMLGVARTKNGNLEMKLYELNQKAQSIQLDGVNRLYSLLEFLDHKGVQSRLFEEGMTAEHGTLYLIEDHIEHGFDESSKQISPISMIIQSKTAYDLVDVINHHGLFQAEMKEWNGASYQAHILLHPF
ncbi:DUF2913 family protein (plasmid) [Vibrio scophthalmi]|uniref:DUF2913 family protein n=1 Tax=Vibrio scophthalmi TaxID=45658 RepID=UPI003EB7F11D